MGGSTLAATASNLVGRDRELADIDAVLAAARAGVAALLLEGEPGIGKTVLVDEAVRRARTSGVAVLSCRPAHAEAVLSLSAVSDLVATIGREHWSALPPPQRRALDVALLNEEPGPRPVSERAIAAGVRSLITGLGATGPVLVALDDAHWLDNESAAVLDFVLRRLDGLPVALVVARRLGEPCLLEPRTLLPERALALRRLEALPLEPMVRLLRSRVGPHMNRETLARVHRAAGGNPLFAIEIGRALGDTLPAAVDPLPLPGGIRDLVARRAGELPRRTRTALLAAALLAEPTVAAISAAVETDALDALGPAERDGFAAVRAGRVVFAHPLHAAAVESLATAAERLAMHQALAGTVEDVEQRGHHLAAAAVTPNESIASSIESAADAALARGGLHAAARLLERARALTPATTAGRARGRGLRAAELHVRAGERGDARRVLGDLLAEPLLPGERAEALRLLGELAFSDHDLTESHRLLGEAAELAEDPDQLARIELDLVYLRATSLDFPGASHLAHRAIAHLRASTDRHLLGEALSYAVMVDFVCGRGVAWPSLDQALELEHADRLPSLGMAPSAIAAMVLLFVGRHDEARRQMATTHDRQLERGNDVDRSQLLMWWSFLETRVGDLRAAARLADEAIATAELARNRALSAWASAQRAAVHALCGERAAADVRLADAATHPAGSIPQLAIWRAWAIASLELPGGNAHGAWDACRDLTEAIERDGLAEPIPFVFLPDAIEALVELGELDRAAALATRLEERGAALDRAWASATGARTRAIVHMARGQLIEAVAAADDALVHHERIDLPLDRARALLVRGMALRRRRKWLLARTALEEAASELERLGASLWHQRAVGELARVAGRRGTDGGGLTPAEHRVAELAADGLPNKAIARILGVSVHTVEAHLSRIYTKLGVRSRSQLAGRLASSQPTR